MAMGTPPFTTYPVKVRVAALVYSHVSYRSPRLCVLAVVSLAFALSIFFIFYPSHVPLSPVALTVVLQF